MIESPRPFRASPFHGFTLVEMLVALSICSIILVVLAIVTSETQRIWLNTLTRVEQFRSAETAFATMTQRLSQATLNTYTGYSDGTAGHTFYNDATFAPVSFVRQSELRFLSGSCVPSGAFAGTMSNVAGISSSLNPTHSIFFLAPLGYSSTAAYEPLTQVLNICGYYLQFGSNPSLPSFYVATPGYQLHYRYRLMEIEEPSEKNSVYNYTTATPYSSSAFHSSAWISDAFNTTPSCIHVLAENIIALIILPQLGQNEIQPSTGKAFSSSALAPTYAYDSTTIGAAGASDVSSQDAGSLNSSAQLPPVVQLTMVAIDEPSAVRLQKQFQSSPPDFGINSGKLFQNSAQYAADLAQLEANLQQSPFVAPDSGISYSPTVILPKKITYRVFTTFVSIKDAQWNTNQSN